MSNYLFTISIWISSRRLILTSANSVWNLHPHLLYPCLVDKNSIPPVPSSLSHNPPPDGKSCSSLPYNTAVLTISTAIATTSHLYHGLELLTVFLLLHLLLFCVFLPCRLCNSYDFSQIILFFPFKNPRVPPIILRGKAKPLQWPRGLSGSAGATPPLTSPPTGLALASTFPPHWPPGCSPDSHVLAPLFLQVSHCWVRPSPTCFLQQQGLALESAAPTAFASSSVYAVYSFYVTDRMTKDIAFWGVWAK